MGLRLFIQSDLSTRRKVAWSAFLVLVGAAIGMLLSLNQIWHKGLLLLVALPVLAAADRLLLGGRRSLGFWIRACGFEVCTVFGVAAAARYVCNVLELPPVLGAG